MDKISFPYRSNSHLTLLHVVAESGAWEKYGLDVDYDRHISSDDAHHAHAAHSKEFENKVTASGAAGSVDCDEDCAPNH